MTSQTIEVATPGKVLLGLTRPGENETARTSAAVTDGEWHHLAVTIDQDPASGQVSGQMFVDGKPGGKAVLGSQSKRLGARHVSIEELECYVYVRK